MIPAEFKVVANEIKPRFRTNKDTVEDVELQASAHISKQVIGAGEVRAGKEAARKRPGIKPDAFASQSAFQLSGCSLAYRRSIHCIEVIEDRPEGQKSLREISLGPPVDFAAHAKVLDKEKITAEADESAATDGLREELAGG